MQIQISTRTANTNRPLICWLWVLVLQRRTPRFKAIADEIFGRHFLRQLLPLLTSKARHSIDCPILVTPQSFNGSSVLTQKVKNTTLHVHSRRFFNYATSHGQRCCTESTCTCIPNLFGPFASTASDSKSPTFHQIRQKLERGCLSIFAFGPGAQPTHNHGSAAVGRR